MCLHLDMAEDGLAVEGYVRRLKTVVPAQEHGALDSRLEELLNDPNASDEDVIEILGKEFNPKGK